LTGLKLPPVISLAQHWSELVGKPAPADSKSQQRSDSNKKRDELIARKLEAAGYVCREKIKEDVFDVPLDGSAHQLVAKKGEMRPKRWMVFYQHQAAIGREINRRLHIVMNGMGQDYKGRALSRYVRMGVVSFGFVELNEQTGRALAKLRAIVRKAGKKLDEYGVELLFSNVEFPLVRDTNGQVWLNLHSHILSYYSKILGADGVHELNEAIREIAERGGGKRYFHDAGAVKKLDELTKYMVKGDVAEDGDADDAEEHEMLVSGARRIGMMELTSAETALLHRAVFRRNRFMPYGRAKQLWNLLENGRTVEEIDESTGEILTRKQTLKIAPCGKNDDGSRKLMLTPKFPREAKAQYGQEPGPRTNIVLGTAIRAVERPDGTRELVGCVRVMSPTLPLDELVQRRRLFKLVELHERLMAAARARQGASLSIKDTPTVKFSRDRQNGSRTGPPLRLAVVA